MTVVRDNFKTGEVEPVNWSTMDQKDLDHWVRMGVPEAVEEALRRLAPRSPNRS